MPIHISEPITVFDQEAFHGLDKVVTGLSFHLHNQYGRFLDERLYQAAMAASLATRGLRVLRELKMTLTLDTFRKDYFADFLLNGGVIVEAKTVETLTDAHKAQVLNYLYLCGLHHATLLNLRTDRVQHQFVSTSLTDEQRRQIIWDINSWTPLSAGCDVLRSTLVRAFEDWGARLDLLAYRDAVIHVLGGEEMVIRQLPVESEDGVLGFQKACLLAEDIAFSITASSRSPGATLEHQRRFLQHTRLRAIQWVNLNGQTVTLHTIRSDS